MLYAQWFRDSGYWLSSPNTCPTWDIPIPNDPGLVGLVFFLQAADAAGPVLFSVTNAIEGMFGG